MSEIISKKDNVAPAPHRSRAAMGRAVSLASTAVIALVTLLPASSRGAVYLACIICGATGGADAFLNVLLFVPLGLGLGLARVRASRGIVGMCLFTIAIESLQLAIPGRDASFGDVIANSIGGAIGFVIGQQIESILRPRAVHAWRLVLAWSALWLAVQSAIAYAFVPSIPRSQLYGQLARSFDDGSANFEGTVMVPSVEEQPILDSALEESQRLRASLTSRGGALFQARVIARGCSRGLAPIVRIAADGDVAVLNATQLGRDFIFGIRTGADVLRLRRVRFKLRDVFASLCSASLATDTISLQGRYALSRAYLHATSRDRSLQQTSVPRLSQGWRLIMPRQTYVDAGLLGAIAGWVWMAALIAPAAYWARFAYAGKSVGARAAVFACCLAFLMAGLVGIPMLFGVPLTPSSDWLAALSGAALGVVAARSA